MEGNNQVAGNVKFHPESFNMKYHHGLWCVESMKQELMDDVVKFPMRPSDVMVVSYPKSGVFWLAEVLYAVHYGSNMADNRKSPIGLRVPFLEHGNKFLPDPLGTIAARPSPRLYKSHLAADFYSRQLDEGQPKVVVVLRNPKDTLAACFQWYKNTHYFTYPGDFDDYFDLYKAKMLVEGDPIATSLSWWRRRHNDNILVLKYEDIVRNPASEIIKIAKFCGKELSNEDVNSISRFVEQESGSEGPVGMWQEHFNAEQLEFIERQAVGPMAKENLVFTDTSEPKTDK